MIPYRICFEVTPSVGEVVLDYFIDTGFVIDMALTFRTAYYDVQEKAFNSISRDIRNNYFKTWFAIDFLSTAPIDTIISEILTKGNQETDVKSQVRMVKLIRGLRLIRLLKLARLLKLGKFMKNVEDYISISPAALKMFKLLFNITFIAHIFACVWFYVSTIPEEGMLAPENNWWINIGIDDTSNKGDADENQVATNLGIKYTAAIYWAFTTMTTVGYGDVTPQTLPEKWMAIIAMILGATIFGFVVGSVSSMVGKMDVGAARLREQMAMIKDYMREQDLPRAMKLDIENFFEFYFQRKSVFDEQKILHDLPPFLRKKVVLFVNEDIVEKLPMFRDEIMTNELACIIITAMQPSFQSAGGIIYQEGDAGSELYFIIDGRIRLTVSGEEASEKGQQITEGGSFGGLEFIMGSERSTRAVAEVYSNFMYLSHTAIDHIIERVPDLSKQIQYILSKYVTLSISTEIRDKLDKSNSWLDDNMEANTNSVILSLEMLLYGGLIGSRSGNESLAEINERLDWLVSFQQKHKDIPFYISTTVMRIPSYNGDFEEPWYWEYYGRDLYEYSFFLGRFDELGDPADLKAANGYKSMVPSSIVDKFLWRRARNFNITKKVFEFQSDLHLFESLYLTLDDSGEYGLNVNEAIALKKMAHGLNLDKTKVRIYPGADEVESCLLSKMLTAEISKPPLVSILWRAPNATKLIPNYENQPIEETVRDQIEACGGQVVEGNEADYDILFAVNNFASSPQLEASQQGPPSPKSSRDYQVFDGACDSCGKTLALADVRYSNGGDLAFVEYIKSHINGKDTAPCLTPGRFSYAGWNTDGNTLGTVAANAVILAVLNDNSLTLEENKRFTLLRLLEDVYYQGTGVRDTLIEYIGTTSDDINELNADLPFYEGFSYKPLSLLSEELAKLLDIKFEINPPLAKAYYPWNRTFEIGFELEKMVQDRAQVRQKSPGAKNFSPVQAYCDIIIAGGSTSALAAAFAAADEGPNLSVCLIEPTSWAGGQMTSSLVTALDFGKRNRKLSCMTKNLAKYLQSQKYPFNNPGKCWVSTYCYQAKDMLRNFIMPEIKKRQNLRVYFNTVVSTVTTSSTNEGATIESVVGIFRAAKSNEYLSVPYSAQVEDWFSAEESAMFHKDTITFSSAKSKPIVIDATENGDILVTSGAQYVQGNEYEESSIKTDETCGQAIAFTFYLAEAKIGAESVRGENGHPTNFSLGKYGWDTVWSYRRVSPGISLMAWGSNNGNGNDYPYGYHLLPVEETKKQQPYRGGLNLTTLQQAETYALDYGKEFPLPLPLRLVV
eukprot:g1929.t1